MRPIRDSINKLLTLEQSRYGCLRHHVLHDHKCKGGLTREHVWIYAGQQVDELWAIIILCDYAHSVNRYQDGGILDKEMNEWLSFGKVKPGDLEKYPRKDWQQRRKYLELKFGAIPSLF